MDQFPIVKAGHVFNEFCGKISSIPVIKNTDIELLYPCRLDAMAINPAAVAYNSKMFFTPGEVVVSVKKYIHVKVRIIDEEKGNLLISKNVRRKVLIKHAYLLMCHVLNVSPSLEISVDDSIIPKHCGFGSSSSTICAVAVAINELYGNPINHSDLIRYLASNHGEEVSDDNEDELKAVQCIGGGATNGLTEEGIMIISGRATTIAKMKYDAKVLICIPKDFQQKDAKLLMELEEKNLWKFKQTGELYSEKIAYEILHKAIPGMLNGSIRELSEIVFDYRFNMGSIDNCSFVYDRLNELGKELRKLYENNMCDFLALSSVGPAFFAFVSTKEQYDKCKKMMIELEMDVLETEICNTKYVIKQIEKKDDYWQQEETAIQFALKKPSTYITSFLDTLNLNKKMCLDVGCGGGRYSKYLMEKGADVLAIDKNEEMFKQNNYIHYIQANMDHLPLKDNSYFLVLSIGVIHNAVTIREFEKSIQELERVTVHDGYIVLSVFTNDLITSDLTAYGENIYGVRNRQPMVLLPKNQINRIIYDHHLKIEKTLDEHITDVGIGKRNVYTVLLRK